MSPSARFGRRLAWTVLAVCLTASLTAVTAVRAQAASGGSVIANGSFSSGDSGFTSGYTAETSLGAPDTYAIGADPNTLNGAWPTMGDHTSGTGSMMIVNGGTTADAVVWSETVAVSPGATYRFSAWVATLYSDPAELTLSINGKAVATLDAPTAIGSWTEVGASWLSHSSSTAVLSIVDDNLGFGGNDFALDDLSFASGAHVRVSTIASSITSPSKAFSSGRRTVENLGAAALVVLLITFPSQLFNHTLDQNRADIRAWWERRFKLVARVRKRLAKDKRRVFRDTTAAVLVVLCGALLGGLLDPNFGLTGSSAVTYASLVCSTTLGIAVSGLVIYHYRKRRGRSTKLHFHAIPAGLLIAASCVLVSRLASFEPGYLYGIVCGVAFRGALPKEQQGHTVALSILATIMVALVAWAAWIPLNHLAEHPHEAWPVVFADDFAGAVFTGGIVGSAIGCFPLRFLPGGTIVAWHRGAWAAVFAFTTFVFLELILNPGRGGHRGHAPLATAIVLFTVFGVGSVAFYAHFARKKRPKPAAPLKP